ncbi:hypothetical protein LWI29_014954 [Acer saccharum]|uniref:Uncharacterized protein n=1 Tax=Acer saccharum TaxID=4024 RepID=A0AA39W8Y6_ACESA|nr:hypothetical protein LWI29_014954 [Acer saccharum]
MMMMILKLAVDGGDDDSGVDFGVCEMVAVVVMMMMILKLGVDGGGGGDDDSKEILDDLHGFTDLCPYLLWCKETAPVAEVVVAATDGVMAIKGAQRKLEASDRSCVGVSSPIVGAVATLVKEKKEEPKEESDDYMRFGLC